jgi:hypothetical protein
MPRSILRTFLHNELLKQPQQHAERKLATKSNLAAILLHPLSHSSILKLWVQGRQERRLQQPKLPNNMQCGDRSKDARLGFPHHTDYAANEGKAAR